MKITNLWKRVKKIWTRFVDHCKVVMGISVQKGRGLVIVFSKILIEIYEKHRDILYLAGYIYLVLFYSVLLFKVLIIIYGLTRALINIIYLKGGNIYRNFFEFEERPMYLYRQDLVNVVIVMLGLTRSIFRISQRLADFLYSRGVDIDPLDLFVLLYLFTTVFVVVLFAK